MLLPAATNAQTTLQGATSGLQPQSAPAQPSVNTQNQTGSLQNNNGSSVLNGVSGQPLGVVSSPGQTVPEAVATPSSTLKTDVTNVDEANSLPIVLAGVGAFICVVALLYFLSQRARPPSQAIIDSEEQEVVPEKPAPKPRPAKSPKKTARKRKKKKSRQR